MSDTSDSSDDEPEGLSQMVYQTGRVPVGNNDDEVESIRVQVEFEWAFRDPPVVICSVEGQEDTDHPDCFGCTVVNVSEGGCEVNVGRCHKEVLSWGQNITLNWCAVISKDTELLQAKTVEAGQKGDEDEDSMEVKIKFKTSFPKETIPKVICTAYGEDHPDCFSCTLRRVTRKHAFVRIARTNPNYKSWGQNLQLNYIATTCFPSEVIEVGSKDSDDNSLTIPDIQFPGKFKKKPTVFIVTHHQSGSEYPDTFAVCSTNVQKESFQMNISRIHVDEVNWGMNLRADYIVIP
jgi:hypothetical protein